MSTPDLTKVCPDNLYNFRVKSLFNRCGYTFYRVRDYDKLAGIPPVYFFNETFSAWASLQTRHNLIMEPGKKFIPKFKRGEIVFLRKMKEIVNTKSVVIMEFKNGPFYSTLIKKKYGYEDLLPFDMRNFFL